MPSASQRAPGAPLSNVFVIQRHTSAHSRTCAPTESYACEHTLACYLGPRALICQNGLLRIRPEGKGTYQGELRCFRHIYMLMSFGPKLSMRTFLVLRWFTDSHRHKVRQRVTNPTPRPSKPRPSPRKRRTGTGRAPCRSTTCVSLSAARSKTMVNCKGKSGNKWRRCWTFLGLVLPFCRRGVKVTRGSTSLFRRTRWTWIWRLHVFESGRLIRAATRLSYRPHEEEGKAQTLRRPPNACWPGSLTQMEARNA